MSPAGFSTLRSVFGTAGCGRDQIRDNGIETVQRGTYRGVGNHGNDTRRKFEIACPRWSSRDFSYKTEHTSIFVGPLLHRITIIDYELDAQN